jgi:hypothetical protein
MKKTLLMGLVLIAILFISGCNAPPYEPDGKVPEPEVEINPITGEPYQDIVEKRGVKTNITEFNELLRRATKIESYKYTITDTDLGVEGHEFYVLGRFVKIRLPGTMQHGTGEFFDEVLMDRVTKTAFSHCSRDLCPKPDIDKGLEKVEYSDYYISDPMEYLYRVTKPEYIEEEMVGDQYTKVFNARFEGNEARVWLQEYYGFIVKMIVKNEDGTKRVIKFEDMLVDNTRRGEIDLPFNFTVKGEQGSWYFWEHYLGEWPPKGMTLEEFYEQNPALGV